MRWYHVAYDSSSTSDLIDITLITFGSAHEAASFVSVAAQVLLDGQSYEAPTQHAYSSIPGAVEVNGTKLSGGSVDYNVILAKGTTVMGIDYSTDHLGTPAVLGTLVASQYARL